MEYQRFFETYGGSARTKNLPSLRKRVSAFLHRKPLKEKKRPYWLPRRSPLPKDYIRLDPWEMEYLFLIARRAKKGIVEIGRFNGGSTFLMSCANPDVPIWSVDKAPQNDDLLRSYFEQENRGGNVRLLVGDSQQGDYPEITAADVLFIDGDHTYEGCYADIRNWYDKLSPNGHMILHDAYEGKWGVQDAILDAMDQYSELQVVQSPIISHAYWRYPAGSICHLIKRA